MRKVLLAGALLALMTPGARAADPSFATVVPASFTWTGFYAGVHVGFGTGQAAGHLDPAANHRFNGPLIGIQLGFNHQLPSNVVVGLEGTFAWAQLKGSVLVDNAPLPFGQQFQGTTLDFLATFGPRLGFAMDRTLFYAKGGLAAAAYTGRFWDNGGPESARNSRIGWFVGIGVEHAFSPGWSAKAEYNYIHLGSGNTLYGQGFVPQANRKDIHTFTVGVNYRFVTGPSAVVARY